MAPRPKSRSQIQEKPSKSDKSGKGGKAYPPKRKSTTVSVKSPRMSKSEKGDRIDRASKSIRPGRCGRVKKNDKPKQKRPGLRMKGALKSPADWARFNLWVQTKALPRKIPEPEPIIRKSKPLYKLRRGIECLSRPKKYYCVGLIVRRPQVRKSALRAKPTGRTLCLSLPKVRPYDCGRTLPVEVTCAAMFYKASQRIVDLSKPKAIYEPEECMRWRKCNALLHVASERIRQLALAKKLNACPGGLTELEKQELFTYFGVKKSALEYKLTAWMSVLILPKYLRLKDRCDDDAIEWKRMIVELGEARNKQAYEEYLRKRGIERERDNAVECDAELAKRVEKRKKKQNAWRYAPSTCVKIPNCIRRSVLCYTATERISKLAEHVKREAKTCKKNAFSVKRGALAATPSGRISKLAMPKMPRPPVKKWVPGKKNKYGVVIWKKPRYGKRLPKVPPYKARECPEPEEKKEREKEKKCRPIDPIAYRATIDPVIDYKGAQKQKKERERAEKILAEKRKQKLEKTGKSIKANR